MANQEAFTLDGLALNDGITFGVDQVSWPPPAQRQNWIGAADSEAQLLFRNPLHENRKVTLRVGVLPQTTMDLALAKVAQVVDKLAKASKTTDGIALVWTPATATLSCTFDVLSGEITDLPIDWENGWLALAPTFTIELTCKPYWRGVRGAHVDQLELHADQRVRDRQRHRRHPGARPADHHGHGYAVPPPCRVGLGGAADVQQRDVAADRLRQHGHDGFSGAQAVTTGAYDPNASGNNSITLTPIAGATTAMAGTGDPLSHVGVFRVKARVQSGSLLNLFRLSWKAGDGPTNHNDWATPISTANWQEIDLGTITIPAVTLGTQRWTGQIEVQAAPVRPGRWRWTT
jgi:hypothetical protein